MPDLTTNHGLQLWAAGELDWEHRDDMQAIERTMTIRDFDANLSNYTAYDGARFEATDTHAIYLGDGSNWNAITPKPTQDHIDDTSNPHSVTASQTDALPITGGTLSGQLTIDGDGTASQEGLTLETEMDIYPIVDSSQSYNDASNFNVTVADSQGSRPEIHWRRHVHDSNSNDEAFGVHDATADNTLFEIRESGDVLLDGGGTLEFPLGADMRSDVDSAAGNDNQEFNIQHHDSSGADEIHWLRNASSTEALGVRNNTVGYSNRLLSINDDGSGRTEGPFASGAGFVAEQRGAPTTSELADGERMQYTSDGTDAHSAGDLVSARNNAGTIVSQVIAAAADDA